MITSSRIRRKHNDLAINQFLSTILRLLHIEEVPKTKTEEVPKTKTEEVFETKIEESPEGETLKIATSATLKINVKMSSAILKAGAGMSSAT